MRFVLALAGLLSMTAHASSQTLSSTMRKASPRYLRCYKAALKRDSGPVSGKAKITVTVLENGSVEAVQVDFPEASPLLKQCLRDVTVKLRFPEASEPYAITWPVIFVQSE